MFVRTPYDSVVNLNQYAEVKLESYLKGRHEIFAISIDGQKESLAFWSATQEKDENNKAKLVYEELITALATGERVFNIRELIMSETAAE